MPLSNKCPPELESKEDYENWKDDVMTWCDLTDLPKEKHALAIQLSLTGRARQAAKQLSRETLKVATGVDVLMKKLDDVFLLDKGRRQFFAFHELYNLRRKTEAYVKTFISEFENIYFKFTKQGMTLPDPVIAFMLLASCNLSDDKVQLVMSAVRNVTLDEMKNVLKRVFGGETENTFSSDAVKVEPVFQSAKSSSETLYARGGSSNNRGRFRGTRGRGGYGRGSTQQRSWRGGSYSRGFAQQQYSRGGGGGGRRLNRLDEDGNITRCVICESKYHWAKDCQHAHENNPSLNALENTDSCEVSDIADNAEDPESVHLLLFMGYTSGDQQYNKLNKLVSDSHGYALLDTGCSTTVCGEEWLNHYVQNLTEYDASKIVEKTSSASFTFGDGASVKSLKRVLLPVYIGGKRSKLETDVVKCNVPLLLSKSSMKKGKMILDFERDIAELGGEKILLSTAASGHYLLPLTM